MLGVGLHKYLEDNIYLPVLRSGDLQFPQRRIRFNLLQRRIICFLRDFYRNGDALEVDDITYYIRSLDCPKLHALWKEMQKFDFATPLDPEVRANILKIINCTDYARKVAATYAPRRSRS